MAETEDLPPANLILQALHGIRADLKDVRGGLTEVRHGLSEVREAQEQTTAEIAKTNARLSALEKRTTEGFLETNTKLAALAKVVEQHDRRLDHLLTKGIGAEVRDLRLRVSKLESARVSRPRKR